MPPIKRRMSSGVDPKLPSSGYRKPKKFRKRLYKYETEASPESPLLEQRSASNEVENPHNEDLTIEAETENSENRYHVEKIIEKRFPGMIWDVGFMPLGHRGEYIFVCHGSGVSICDQSLEQLRELDIGLPGGAAVAPNGNLVVLDRSTDVVVVYARDGSLLTSFPGGASPMAVAVDSASKILVTDAKDKCVRMFWMDGGVVGVLPTKGEGYALQWPLYVTSRLNSSAVLSDTMQHKVVAFDAGLVRARVLSLHVGRTHRVRPHGVCAVGARELLVVDTCVDNIELFECGADDVTAEGAPSLVHVQTLIESRDGMKPRVVRCGGVGHLVVGGALGLVRLYKMERMSSAGTSAQTGGKAPVLVPERIVMVPFGKVNERVSACKLIDVSDDDCDGDDDGEDCIVVDCDSEADDVNVDVVGEGGCDYSAGDKKDTAKVKNDDDVSNVVSLQSVGSSMAASGDCHAACGIAVGNAAGNTAGITAGNTAGVIAVRDSELGSCSDRGDDIIVLD